MNIKAGFFVKVPGQHIDKAMVSVVDSNGYVWFVFPGVEGGLAEFSMAPANEVEYLGRTGAMTFSNRGEWDNYKTLLEADEHYYGVALAFAWAEGTVRIDMAP